MRTTLIVTSLLAAALTCGCEETPPPRAPTAEDAPVVGITRDVAIAMARRNAVARFGDPRVSLVAAQTLGRFWVVELRAGGRGLHYAISKNDGTIKERSVVQ